GTPNNWSGNLYLSNDALIIDYSASSPLTAGSLGNQLRSGYNGGAWNGNGVMSSFAAAAASSAHPTSIGSAEATDLFTTFPNGFRFQSVDDNTNVLLRYTYAGDANLDGIVDTQDF